MGTHKYLQASMLLHNMLVLIEKLQRDSPFL